MKKVICIVLVIALIACLPVLSSAAGIETVGVNEEWSDSWSSSTHQNKFLFECTETGFYDVVFKDANKTAALWIDMEYETEDIYDSPLYGRINFEAYDSDEYVVEQIIFTAGRTYEVTLTYHTILEDDSDYNVIYNTDYVPGEGEYQSADISVLFKPSDALIFSLSAQDSYFEINDITKTWFEFTTTDAGDYLFKNDFDVSNDDFYGYFDVYEVGPGTIEGIGYGYFESHNKILFGLKANTTYYVAVHLEGSVSKYSKLSLSRVSNPIVDLLQISVPYEFDPWDPSGYSYARYKVQYEDGSEEILDTYAIKEMGYNISNLYYEGDAPEDLAGEDSWYYNDGVLYPAGRQLFRVTFKGEDYYFELIVQSVCDYFSDSTPGDPGDKFTIEYEDSEEHSYYWRFKTDVSGNYAIYTYGDYMFRDCFDSYQINIIDSNNHCVEWSDESNFYLESGEEYVINVRYHYADDVYRDLNWTCDLDYVLGDADNSGIINSDDAVYLLGHTLFAEYYPLSQPCDFDGNGQVNSDDAVYLLGYTLFPEYYPLH